MFFPLIELYQISFPLKVRPYCNNTNITFKNVKLYLKRDALSNFELRSQSFCI